MYAFSIYFLIWDKENIYRGEIIMNRINEMAEKIQNIADEKLENLVNADLVAVIVSSVIMLILYLTGRNENHCSVWRMILFLVFGEIFIGNIITGYQCKNWKDGGEGSVVEGGVLNIIGWFIFLVIYLIVGKKPLGILRIVIAVLLGGISSIIALLIIEFYCYSGKNMHDAKACCHVLKKHALLFHESIQDYNTVVKKYNEMQKTIEKAAKQVGSSVEDYQLIGTAEDIAEFPVLDANKLRIAEVWDTASEITDFRRSVEKFCKKNEKYLKVLQKQKENMRLVVQKKGQWSAEMERTMKMAEYSQSEELYKVVGDSLKKVQGKEKIEKKIKTVRRK